MKFLIYAHVFIIFFVVRGNCVDCKNRIDSDSGVETDCSCKVKDEASSDCENNNVKNIKEPVKKPVTAFRRKTFRKVPIVTINNDPPTVNVLTSIEEYTVNHNTSSHEADSLDEEQDPAVDFANSTDKTTRITSPATIITTVATEYMEEFRNPITLPSTTLGSIYSGNRSSEESDESKSTLKDYPFSVSIQRKGAHYTSGALLDKLWVITSAGEYYNVRDTLKLFRARLGSVDCKNGGKVVPFKNIEFHPYYIPGKPNFDVAMLRMAHSIEFTDVIRPIAISTVKGKVLSAKFMTTYWPRILVKGSILPKSANERIQYNSMRVSTQRLIPRNKCIKMIKSLNEVLNESTLCLKPVISHHSDCMPDAGAPIVAEDGIWGITSGWISPTCPDLAAPTVFTRLSSPPVRSWLNTVLHT